MNFTSIQPGTSQYHKQMMRRHRDQQKTRRENASLRMNITPLQINKNVQQNKQNAVESLQRAGQTLLNNSFTSPTLLGSPTRRRQVDEENERMKRLVRQRMKQSLLQQQQKKKNQAEEERRLRKVMSVENGVLDYLQKQIQKRNDFIDSCIAKQQVREKGFVDENLRRHNNAVNLIQQNYDVDVFNHESDRYQEKQKRNFQKMLQTNHYQTQINRISRQMEKSEYGKYLDPKYPQERHNPITNPKPYHYGYNMYITNMLNKY